MNSLLEKVGDLNDLLLQGQNIEALERFYDEEVEVQENDQYPLKGKRAAIESKKKFLSTIVEFDCVRPLKVAVGEGTTMVEWKVSYRIEEGERNYTQVAVQDWKNGLIIREKFYFNPKEIEKTN